MVDKKCNIFWYSDIGIFLNMSIVFEYVLSMLHFFLSFSEAIQLNRMWLSSSSQFSVHLLHFEESWTLNKWSVFLLYVWPVFSLFIILIFLFESFTLLNHGSSGGGFQ